MKKYIKADNTKLEPFNALINSNPMTDDIHTGIREVDEIHTFKEVWKDVDEAFPDFTKEDAMDAIKKNRLTVYSSFPIELGTFVTPSKMEAESYAGGSRIYSKLVKPDDVAWIDVFEGQYAPLYF